MSSRKQIGNTLTITTMDDPVSVQSQYSPDMVTIHTTWQDGDLYMRTRASDDVDWSSWHKIVGESGDETEYSFNISKSKTSTNSTTEPPYCYYTNWQNAPVETTSTHPYMWMKIVKKTWNESTQSYDSSTPSYARVTGEKGDDGANAPYIELSRSTILYQANNDGYSISSQNFDITYYLKVKGNTCTISSTSSISISLPSNVTVVSGTKTTSGCTINCANNEIMSGVITITITGTYDGVTYTATGTITVDSLRRGEQGEQGEKGDAGSRGKIGRFFYYAGEFDSSNATQTFVVNDAQAPYFSHGVNSSTGLMNCHVYNPTENGTFTMEQMWDNSSQSWNNEPWDVMTNDFKYLITQAIFGKYAHLGSFIINGDWLISQNGKENNIDSTDYQSFDPNFAKGCYLCQGVRVDASYKQVGSNVFIGGKTYTITLIGEEFSSDSGVINVRMYNGTSNVGSTINLTPANPTQTLTFTPPSTGLYYVRVDMQNGGTYGTLTSYVNNVFIPNYAIDALQGTSYQHESYISGILESEDIDMGNKISIDAKNGAISMTGPTAISEDDKKPLSNSRIELLRMEFDYDGDTLSRYAKLRVNNATTEESWAYRGLLVDPLLGFIAQEGTFNDKRAWLNSDGVYITWGSSSGDKGVEISPDGVSIRRGSTYTTKTWEEIFNNQ